MAVPDADDSFYSVDKFIFFLNNTISLQLSPSKDQKALTSFFKFSMIEITLCEVICKAQAPEQRSVPAHILRIRYASFPTYSKEIQQVLGDPHIDLGNGIYKPGYITSDGCKNRPVNGACGRQ